MSGRVTAAGVSELRSLIDALPFDLWLRDREQVCVYANPFAVARWPGLVGSKPEDAGGKPEVVEIWRNNNARAMAGEVVRGEVHYVIAGEERTFVNLIAPVVQDGEIVGTAGVNLDVTELRDREAEVQRLQALVQGIFDNAPIAIGLRAIHGDELVHVEDNPKAAALLSTSAIELRGKSERELGVSADDVERAISRFRQARAASRPLPLEVTYDSAKGPCTVVGTVAPLPDEAGDERYVFIGEDVTELRALEAGLMHADRLATLGTMAAGLAHEINNPLTFVQANLVFSVQRLEKAARAPAPQADDAPDGLRRVTTAVLEDLRTAAVGVERIGSLVREMLALSRPSKAQKAARADVRLTIGSVLGLAASRLRGLVEVEQDLADVPPVAADAMKLGQVLLNLLTNAAQAIEERGQGSKLWIRAALAADGAHVVLRIEDDGPGIPTELREKLFTPFATGRSEGNGLGLFLCRRLLSEMGGTIEAMPRPGGGTTMLIELPIASPESNAPHESRATDAGATKRG